MQRVRKEALNQVDDGCIIKVFPDKLERSTTSLILKSTKTASSCRTIFMTSALKEELKKWLNQLAADEMKDPARYHDSGMLFRLPNGLAVEPVLIRKKFLKWQDTIIDGIFVSAYVGTNALAAINIVYPIVNVLTGIALVFATGDSAVAALHIGGNRKDEANRAFSVSSVAAVLLGCFVSLIVLTNLLCICNSCLSVSILDFPWAWHLR